MSRSRRNAKADEYFRRAPNYSAKAIRFFREWEDESCPDTNASLRWFADLLQSATKFTLPFGGRFFETTPSVRDIGSWRPPYPLTAFEFDANAARDAESGIPDCVLPVVCLTVEGRGWVWLFMFSRQPSGWSPCAFWHAFERDGITGGCDFRDLFPGIDMGKTGVCTGIIPGLATSVCAERGITSENVAETAIRYLAPALTATVQACAVLSCTNVTTELVRPNREARAARPESTLFDYHVLMIRPGAERHEGPPLGGSHASPRTHLRRGHIRQHPTAGRIWVNSCVVNPTAIGSVNKDYQLQGGIQ